MTDLGTSLRLESPRQSPHRGLLAGLRAVGGRLGRTLRPRRDLAARWDEDGRIRFRPQRAFDDAAFAAVRTRLGVMLGAAAEDRGRVSLAAFPSRFVVARFGIDPDEVLADLAALPATISGVPVEVVDVVAVCHACGALAGTRAEATAHACPARGIPAA